MLDDNDTPRGPEEYPFWVDAEPADAGPDGVRRTEPVAVEDFLYIGQALTANEFTDYVANYEIGSVPPNYVVVHHTAIPWTERTKLGTGWGWDTNEAGKSAEQIKAKRLGQLQAMREYYRTAPALLWDRGPHLFIDDRYIYLFTPMYDVGIHAGDGNSYYDASGNQQYSVGIEVVGYYDHQKWPAETERLVGHAVAVMQRAWGTFELQHKAWGGGVSMHRDYPTSKTCPGTAITPGYFIPIFQQARERLERGGDGEPVSGLSPDSPLRGAASGSREQLAAYLKRSLPEGHEYTDHDVDLILGYYWRFGPEAGIDPYLAVVQSIYDTAGWQSPDAARPHRNPAKLGEGSAPGAVQSFRTWAASTQAHVNHLKAQGEGKRLRDLYGDEYANNVVALAQEIARNQP